MLKRKQIRTGALLLLGMFNLHYSLAENGITDIYEPGSSIIKGRNHHILFNDSRLSKYSPFANQATTSFPLHPSVIGFINEYNEKNEDLFESILTNKSQFLKTIDKVFIQYNVPVELKYMAVVESKLKNNAVSGCGAVGIWQFMPGTAKVFGLKVTLKNDERKNAWKSSTAAAKYLNKLYTMFNDWLLVVAAYNSGPAYVYKAIKKSGSRNFWKLQYFLPKETRMHVKKFIATHYYFEGQGSLVTTGRTETDIYLQKIANIPAEEQIPFPEFKYDFIAISSDRNKNYPLLIVNDQFKLNFIQKR